LGRDLLNIAFFTDTYKPTVNGVVIAVDLFASELRRQGHTVYIIGPKHPDYPAEADFFGLRSIPFKAAPNFRLGLPFSGKFLKKMPDLEVDVVHCHTPGLVGILGWSYAKSKKIPLVQTYHSMLSEYAKHYIPKALWGFRRFVDWWQYLLYNRCAVVTAPTPFIKEYLEQIGIERKVTVLPTGLDLDFFEQVDLATIKGFKLPKDKKIVACVSRMNREKNLDFVLESFAVLHQQNPDTFLLMAGGGPHQEQLEQKAEELQITSSILFTGMVTREQIAALLSLSHVFAYTCHNDTQGLVVIEALAAGKPLFLADERVFDPFVTQGENGYLLAEDQQLFATKMNEVLQDEQMLKSMSAKSAELAKQFSISSATQKLLELYETVKVCE